MSKLIILFALSLQIMFATPLQKLQSYSAHFKQTIIDQDDVKIVYTGQFSALKPAHALWHYKTPIKKSVYINNNEVVIVEPELEQAIYKRVENNFTLFNLLTDAQKVNKTTYEKNIQGKIYQLKVNQNKLLSLHYIDNFDNQVTIVFTKQQSDPDFLMKKFHPIISEDYDIIKD